MSATLTAAASSPVIPRAAQAARRRSAGSRCQRRGEPAPGWVTAPSPCCPTAAAATSPACAPAPAHCAPGCGSGGGGGRRWAQLQRAAVRTRPLRLPHAAGSVPARPPRRHAPPRACRHCRRRLGAQLFGRVLLAAARCLCSSLPGRQRPSPWPPARTCWGSGHPCGQASRTRRSPWRWLSSSCPPGRTRVGEDSDPAAAAWAARRGVVPRCQASPPCVAAQRLPPPPVCQPRVGGQGRLPHAQACCHPTRHPTTHAWLSVWRRHGMRMRRTKRTKSGCQRHVGAPRPSVHRSAWHSQLPLPSEECGVPAVAARLVRTRRRASRLALVSLAPGLRALPAAARPVPPLPSSWPLRRLRYAGCVVTRPTPGACSVIKRRVCGVQIWCPQALLSPPRMSSRSRLRGRRWSM